MLESHKHEYQSATDFFKQSSDCSRRLCRWKSRSRRLMSRLKRGDVPSLVRYFYHRCMNEQQLPKSA